VTVKSSLLDGLNPEQLAAAEAVFEPVLVMAPVGTGKTRTLVARAAQAIASGVAPENILCVSFTNRASKEIRERLQTDLGSTAQKIQARTFHGLCAIICRAESEVLGIDRDFVIWDDDDCREALLRVCANRQIVIDHYDHDRFSGLLSGVTQDAKLGLIHTDYEEHFRVKLDKVNLKNTSRAQAFPVQKIFEDYEREIRSNHAVDFADLISMVRHLFNEDEFALARWQDRLRWIQVDEVQDTNLPEHAILSSLARPTRHLAFFGDVDQTIYEWRHSNPKKILDIFRADFAPVREIQFVRNYRSTEHILNVCRTIIHQCPGAITETLECHSTEPGPPVEFHEAQTAATEAHWLARRAIAIRAEDQCAWRDIAILTRSNNAAMEISAAFVAAEIPHFLAEQYRFFHRAEVRDAVAHLRLMRNPYDGNSLRRVLQRPPKGIGPATLEKIRTLPRALCLRLTDFADSLTYEHGDPYQPLLDAWAENRVVVFDTETTGTDTTDNEIVDIAAVRTGADGEQARLQFLVRPRGPVGLSEHIHGYSDAFLKANGVPPLEALEAFSQFIEGCILVGHNLVFDIRTVESALRREKLSHALPPRWFDTLELTRRFQSLPSYRLGDICAGKGIPLVNAHQAIGDVLATEQLLARLIVPLREHALQRREAVISHGGHFAVLAKQLAEWRSMAATRRPQETLGEILATSGLVEWYRKQDSGELRVQNLVDLCAMFERYDDPSLPPDLSTEAVLEISSLGNDADRYLQKEDRVLLLTVHQAKGLEFPTVILAAATDNEFPAWLAQKEGRLTEEHRLFYVGASRARRRLIFTWHRQNGFGRPQEPSRYLRKLPGFPK